MIFYEKKEDKSMSTTTVPVSRKNGHIAKNDNEKFRFFFWPKKRKESPQKQQQTEPVIFTCVHVYNKLNYIT